MSRTGAARTELPGFSELDEIVARYRPLPGVADEFIDSHGKPRAAWLTFIERLLELGPAEMARRFANADRHVRDAGASYRAYGEASEKTWPLGHLPLLIDAKEWKSIAAGVIQRAELMELLLRDLYGPAHLVGEGAIPAAAVTGSPDFLHPLVDALKPNQYHLHIYAAELGRGPDGAWWVLGDRTQAPSGLGYALANRLILSRTFPVLYRNMNVERLAPFFDGLRAGLASRATRSEPRICLLSAGSYNETYFEQAYLARYLGLLLVEGADLTVRDGAVHVRTIAGLKRADVLLRRVDSDYNDPLELNARSQLGVPGLTQVVRDNGVVVANALGSGVVESPAMMSFMPQLCRRLLGEDLRLPNVATWWCGQPKERQIVLDRLEQMTLQGAFGNAIAGSRELQSILGSEASPQQRELLRSLVAQRGIDVVGQEVVKLSTTPVWSEGQLQPRPFTLRVFAARTPDGWIVMPGGFCRISHRVDVRAVTMGDSVESVDVWVTGDEPVPQTSLLSGETSLRVRRLLGNLPSRAADNLFWFGRYLERAEAVLRLARVYMNRLIELNSPHSEASWSARELESLFDGIGAIEKEKSTTGTSVVAKALFSKAEFGSATSLVERARRAASYIRERLSSDTWRLIEDVCDVLDRDLTAAYEEAELTDRTEAALRRLAAISGLAQENMNRGAGWHLLDMGRRIERAINTCRYAKTLICADGRAEGLHVALELIDSQITYRSRYLIGLSQPQVSDMVMLDPFNPRSVACQVEKLVEHLGKLPSLNQDGMLEQPQRLALEIFNDLTVRVASDVDTDMVQTVEQRLYSLSDAIGTRYFLHGATAVKADKAVGLA